jgi:hypothetical protein
MYSVCILCTHHTHSTLHSTQEYKLFTCQHTYYTPKKALRCKPSCHCACLVQLCMSLLVPPILQTCAKRSGRGQSHHCNIHKSVPFSRLQRERQPGRLPWEYFEWSYSTPLAFKRSPKPSSDKNTRQRSLQEHWSQLRKANDTIACE